MIKNFLVALFTVVFISSAALAEEVNGFCSQVVDANTVVVIAGGSPYTVKLGYMDAPELDQNFGHEAKKFVEELALEKNIKLNNIEIRKGFMIAEVYSPRKQDPVNRLLVRAGLAWAKQDNRYALAQTFAKKRSLGIWSDPDIQSPEEYRAQKEQQLQAAKKKKEELREGRIMDMIIKKIDNEEKTAQHRGYTSDPGECAVAQQTDPYIETRQGYRAEDIEAEAQRLRAEQQVKEREDYCRQGFSSAHSGVGEYSRLQREMDFNEWAIKCGAPPPYTSPDVVIVDRDVDSRYVNKDPYKLGRKKSGSSMTTIPAGEKNQKPGPEYMRPDVEQR